MLQQGMHPKALRRLRGMTGKTGLGSTVEEAVSNLKEATELYLEEFSQAKKKRAILTTFEVSTVATTET